MASERTINALASALFILISIIFWGDYLQHSSQIYGERDAASAQMTQITKDLADAQDIDTVGQLNDQYAVAQAQYDQAEKLINDMDGWNSWQWRIKNAIRLAAPAIAVLFAAFALLSILNPLK